MVILWMILGLNLSAHASQNPDAQVKNIASYEALFHTKEIFFNEDDCQKIVPPYEASRPAFCAVPVHSIDPTATFVGGTEVSDEFRCKLADPQNRIYVTYKMKAEVIPGQYRITWENEDRNAEYFSAYPMDLLRRCLSLFVKKHPSLVVSFFVKSNQRVQYPGSVRPR